MPPSTNIPIEYPGNPEVSIDGTVLPFKEKGLRGKAGSAPPFDLDKPIDSGVTVGGRVALVPGRLMSVNIGHRGPTTGKNKNQSKVRYAHFSSLDVPSGRLTDWNDFCRDFFSRLSLPK